MNKFFEAFRMNADQTGPYFMNVQTGTVDNKRGWDYENEYGQWVNAVDLGQVVEVVRDSKGNWVEV